MGTHWHRGYLILMIKLALFHRKPWELHIFVLIRIFSHSSHLLSQATGVPHPCDEACTVASQAMGAPHTFLHANMLTQLALAIA